MRGKNTGGRADKKWNCEVSLVSSAAFEELRVAGPEKGGGMQGFVRKGNSA